MKGVWGVGCGVFECFEFRAFRVLGVSCAGRGAWGVGCGVWCVVGEGRVVSRGWGGGGVG